MAVPHHAPFVTHGLRQRLPQHNPRIFHRVVKIHLRSPLTRTSKSSKACFAKSVSM